MVGLSFLAVHIESIIWLSIHKGLNQNLVVVLSLYEPAVACFGQQLATRAPESLLQNILSMIPVSTVRLIFGPEGEPGVQVVLPIIYNVSSVPCESNFSLTSFAVSLLLQLIHIADVT